MQHYLNNLFSPDSIAVIGASNRPNSVGMKVLKNLLQSGFKGKLYAINPKHKTVQKQPCFPSIKDIKQPIALAIITTPANTIPAIMTSCGEKGILAAIVLSAGFSEMDESGKVLERKIVDIAKHYGIRFIGPNCLGIMRPHIQMNASFDNNTALPGNLALVSQSGALSSGILDWAMHKEIGFSALISLGNSANVDFGDVLDYLALDPHTKNILLYIEGIHNARHFMSALRVAARMKPIIAIKAGRHAQGQHAALSHTGALIGDDDVFDAALRRAGAIRVMSIDELFSAAEILSTPKVINGNRLAIVTNGGGAGVMAADRTSETNITLPTLSEETITQLNNVLPRQWSHQNPIDIIGDAQPDRYHSALDICMQDKNIDGILTILVPVSMAHPNAVAKQVIADEKQTDKPIIACWMGEKHVRSSWKLFAENQVPHFDTPEKAVQAFSYLADYAMNQKLLKQVPGPLSPQSEPHVSTAQSIIDLARKEDRRILTQTESKAILKAFHIPVTDTISCATENDAVNAARKCGFPVVLKIDSLDITHKSDVCGVQLDINSEEAVRHTFSRLMNRIQVSHPNATIQGVTVEPMFINRNNRELMIGIICDPVFGPVISFGGGGIFVELMKDRALALPPLNHFMANQLISQTRISKLLGQFRHMPPVDFNNLINILLRVSEIACELSAIEEMDINPLLISEKNCVVVDARIVIKPKTPYTSPYSHMAIYPYPHHLIQSFALSDGKSITIRPIRPEDATLQQEFTRALSSKSKYFRFMDSYYELTPEMLVRFTQIDYDREMALIAIFTENDKEKNIGVARYVLNADFTACQFSLVVADDWQQKGIGTQLMHSLIEIAKSKGIQSMYGIVLAKNQPMLAFSRRLGFDIIDNEDPKLKIATKQII